MYLNKNLQKGSSSDVEGDKRRERGLQRAGGGRREGGVQTPQAGYIQGASIRKAAGQKRHRRILVSVCFYVYLTFHL